MPRCLKAEKLSDIASSINVPVIVNTNPQDALRTALEISDDAAVCVCGSLFLAGEIRKNFPKTKNNTCK